MHQLDILNIVLKKCFKMIQLFHLFIIIIANINEGTRVFERTSRKLCYINNNLCKCS